MISRTQLVQGVCKIVGVTRKRPDLGEFSKKELYAVSAFVHLAQERKSKKRGV
jgi:hypothetical protein